jgi:hypothetical protein
MKKKTLVIGASTNPERYSYLAIRSLLRHGHGVAAVGRTPGEVDGVKIKAGTPRLANIDTVTLYLNPNHQAEYADYLLGLKPRRIIFNPGTENHAFMLRANQAGIEVLEACTLVLLGTGQY